MNASQGTKGHPCLGRHMTRSYAGDPRLSIDVNPLGYWWAAGFASKGVQGVGKHFLYSSQTE